MYERPGMSHQFEQGREQPDSLRDIQDAICSWDALQDDLRAVETPCRKTPGPHSRHMALRAHHVPVSLAEVYPAANSPAGHRTTAACLDSLLGVSGSHDKSAVWLETISPAPLSPPLTNAASRQLLEELHFEADLYDSVSDAYQIPLSGGQGSNLGHDHAQQHECDHTSLEAHSASAIPNMHTSSSNDTLAGELSSPGQKQQAQSGYVDECLLQHGSHSVSHIQDRQHMPAGPDLALGRPCLPRVTSTSVLRTHQQVNMIQPACWQGIMLSR